MRRGCIVAKALKDSDSLRDEAHVESYAATTTRPTLEPNAGDGGRFPL